MESEREKLQSLSWREVHKKKNNGRQKCKRKGIVGQKKREEIKTNQETTSFLLNTLGEDK